MNDDALTMTEDEAKRKALEEFVVDNKDLERLELLLAPFNLFEALEAVGVETRHSAFLAFLLDPKQNHGLGDVFLKQLLKKAVTGVSPEQSAISPIDLDVWDLTETQVYRERHNIDILLVNEPEKFVVVTENKIWSGEQPGQLERYRKSVEQYYPDYALVCLFLTPEGDKPMEEEVYVPVDYALICETLGSLVESRGSSLGDDVLTAIRHYTQMLRRYIVKDSEIADLARRIYTRHRKALDIIYEYKPDKQLELSLELKKLIAGNSSLHVEYAGKVYVGFCPKSWTEIPALNTGEGWNKGGRILLFEVKNYSDSMGIYLIIGPGDHSVRERIFAASKAKPELFRGKRLKSGLGQKWSTIFVRNFVSKSDHEQSDTEELVEKVRQAWERFVERDLPALKQAIEEIHFSKQQPGDRPGE
jgi:hypothetical protein